MYKTSLYLYYSLQVYIRHSSYICLYLSNIFVYTGIQHQIYIRAFIPMHTHGHIYVHTRTYPRPRATLSVRSQFTNIGFQYFKEFGLQESRTLRLRIFSIWSWRLSCGVLPQTSLRSHTPTLPHSCPSTSMAHYRQQHPVNHNAAQVARTKPSQYDRLSTMDNGTNTMFFVTVVWRQ